MKHLLLLVTALLQAPFGSAHADDSSTQKRQIVARRSEYLDWIVENFGRLEPDMKPLDGRAWSLNQARLFLNRDTNRASRYFESVKLTFDADFMGIRLLKTWLDFHKTTRLSARAKAHLRGIIRDWPMDRKGGISRTARWPPGFTENHDLMHLTIGLFSEELRSQPIKSQLNELKKFLSWRFERGFYEWGSHRYQLHYTNPLIVLAMHAPDPAIRRAAADQLNIILSERALMSVGGYLGGPGMRSYDRNRGCDYLDNNRYDSFLPTVWLALGMGEPRFDFSKSGGLKPAGAGYGNGRDPRLNQDEAMFFATTRLTPHPIVKELLDEVASRTELVYIGRRASAGHPFQNAHPNNPRSRQSVVYYNTPHVSLGSLQYLPEAGKMSVSYNSRPRFFSVMFPDRPEQVLRTRLSDKALKAGAKSYGYVADRVVQHRDWLIAAGELSASHGLTSRKLGQWDLFRVGRGMCAHMELAGWHVFQVSDLDKFKSEQSFISALQQPTIRDGHAHGKSLNGDSIQVNLKTMSMRVNGVERPSLEEMLHDSPLMSSRFGSGRITIQTEKRKVTFDNSALQFQGPALPDLAAGHGRWGKPVSADATTKVNHARAMGGLSPDRDTLLKAVSILLSKNNGGSVRLAVYAGGKLNGGPQSGSPAKLLFDFGQTPIGLTGWNTVKHPSGIRIPANTPVWIAWKSSGGQAEVAYFEERSAPSNFQPDRGRWDSKAIKLNPAEPWPRIWPTNDSGEFDSYEYSCFLTLEPPSNE